MTDEALDNILAELGVAELELDVANDIPPHLAFESPERENLRVLAATGQTKGSWARLWPWETLRS